jgi:DNA polymerase alpha subunit A
MLYNQLRFYASLFDWDKASKISKFNIYISRCIRDTHPITEETAELAIMNRVFMNDMQQSLEKYLDQSGRRWVELGNLFSFLKI